MSLTQERITFVFKKRKIFEVIVVVIIFLGLASAYFYTERTEKWTSADFNSIAREIPVVVKKYPDNFAKDLITNQNTMSNVRYIWTQEMILEKAFDFFGDFHTARRYMLFVLVFFTSCTTFILYKAITGHTIISILAAIASIIGYIYGVDEFYGFQGVRCAIARYNLGIFAPLLLLLFLGKYREPKWLLVLFFLIGVGVNLHPPVAINIAIVFIISLLIMDGFKKNLSWVGAYIIMVLAGAFPFVINFGSAIMTRGTAGAPMSPSEFYGSGYYLLTNTFLFDTFGMMFNELLFPPFISFLAIVLVFVIWKKFVPSQILTIKNDVIYLLVVATAVSFILLFLNLFLFGWLVPHIVGPNAFSLHRVHRVFFLLTETLLTVFVFVIWTNSSQSLFKRVSVSGILLINLAMGFNWLQFVSALARKIFFVSAENVSIVLISVQSFFLIAVLLFVFLMFKENRRNWKHTWIILLIILISIPNVLLGGGYYVARAFNLRPVGLVLEKRQNEFDSLKQLAKWARSETENTSLFMFITGRESDTYYFKTRAIRSTVPTRSEGLHYLPLRQRKTFEREYEDINKFMKVGGVNDILLIVDKMKVDYIVFSRERNGMFSNGYSNSPVFENDSFIVYSSKFHKD